MPYYEISYEPGTTSVAYYEDDEEMKRALGEHHRRAVNGEPGGPVGAPAERVAAVREYDVHPNEFNPTNTMSADVAKKEIGAMIDAAGKSNDGVIPIDQLAIKVRELTHPMVDEKAHPHDSMFKMKETKVVPVEFLESV